jgi:hypothetical protein
MVTEIAEKDATGRIAEIFAEVRQLYATPYVSAIHRHFATRPGVLEWAWEGVAPMFRSGEAQETGWRIAKDVALEPMAGMPMAALEVWGLDRAAVGQVEAACDSFTRAAPVNLVFGGLVRGLLAGKAGGEAAGNVKAGWVPPAALPSPPAMTDAAKLAPTARAVHDLFRSGNGATAFVPGLYRMLAHWPGFLAHLAVELVPRLDSADAKDAARRLLAEIDGAVDGLLGRLPARTSGGFKPDAAEAAHLNAMIDTYRKTSPELILFGRLVREALPKAV